MQYELSKWQLPTCKKQSGCSGESVKTFKGSRYSLELDIPFFFCIFGGCFPCLVHYVKESEDTLLIIISLISIHS